jgi:chemotaxis signal transduction protein
MMEGTTRHLVFTIRGSRYAIALRNVAEVMEPSQIYPIPHAPHFFPGIMNFHGNLFSVLDLALFLKGAPRNPQGKIVVLDTGIANLSLWVDSIENIGPDETILEEYESDENLVEKLIMMADGEVKMLSVEKLLDNLEELLASAGV